MVALAPLLLCCWGGVLPLLWLVVVSVLLLLLLLPCASCPLSANCECAVIAAVACPYIHRARQPAAVRLDAARSPCCCWRRCPRSAIAAAATSLRGRSDSRCLIIAFHTAQAGWIGVKEVSEEGAGDSKLGVQVDSSFSDDEVSFIVQKKSKNHKPKPPARHKGHRKCTQTRQPPTTRPTAL